MLIYLDSKCFSSNRINWTKWPTSRRRHFKCILVNENLCILIKISVKFFFQDSDWQQSSIGLDNGLAPNRRQAINWIDSDPIHWRIFAALGGNELMIYTQSHIYLMTKVASLHTALNKLSTIIYLIDTEYPVIGRRDCLSMTWSHLYPNRQ